MNASGERPSSNRERWLARVKRFKRGTLWLSLAGFSALCALSAEHLVGVTAQAANTPPASATTSPSPFFSPPANSQTGLGNGVQTVPQTVPTMPLTQTRVS